MLLIILIFFEVETMKYDCLRLKRLISRCLNGNKSILGRNMCPKDKDTSYTIKPDMLLRHYTPLRIIRPRPWKKSEAEPCPLVIG